MRNKGFYQLSARFRVALGISVLGLLELDFRELHFILGPVYWILFVLDALYELLLGLAPWGRRARQDQDAGN